MEPTEIPTPTFAEPTRIDALAVRQEHRQQSFSFLALLTKCERRRLPSLRADVNEVIDSPETVLEMARRHVFEGEERLARQIALVAKLERDNHTEAAALGKEVAEVIRLSLDLAQRHLRDLETRSKR